MLGKVAIENSIESKARRSRQEEKLVKCGTRKMTRGDWSWSKTFPKRFQKSSKKVLKKFKKKS